MEGFNTHELGLLARDLEIISDYYPEEAQAFLKEEAKKTAKKLKANTKAMVKGHGKRTGKGQKTLVKSIRPESPKKKNDGWYVKVVNKAPHAHLFEYGHVQWKPAPGKDRKHQVKTDQFVPGRFPMTKTAAQMGPEIERDAAEMVDRVLRRGGFD